MRCDGKLEIKNEEDGADDDDDADEDDDEDCDTGEGDDLRCLFSNIITLCVGHL